MVATAEAATTAALIQTETLPYLVSWIKRGWPVREWSEAMDILEFRTETGRVVSEHETIFPLFTEGKLTPWRLVGTGFLILKDGIFLTAKHCLTDDEGSQLPWLTGLMAHGHMRRVAQVLPHETCDVAVGVFERGEYDCESCAMHRVLTLSTRTPSVGEELYHFGCEHSRLLDVERLDEQHSTLHVRLAIRGYPGTYEGFNEGDPLAPWPHHFTGSFFPTGSSGRAYS